MKIIKKIIFSLLSIYSYNVLGMGFNLLIGINLINIIIITILGLPGLFGLALFRLII